MPTGNLVLLLQGAAVSLLLAAAAIAGGTLLAVVLAALAFSRLALVRAVYRLYVYVIRGTPLLVLALLVFYAVPALDLRSGPYIAGTLVLIMYVGALFAEVFRGGVLAIPRPQWESARSLGLPPLAKFRKVIAPLVTRYTLPPYVNVCVMTVKASSVLSIISVWELTLAAREIIERTFAVFTILGIAAGLYFVMCFGIDRLGRRLERRLMLRGFVGERA
ncbi:MAG: amino acid ABC transporter permease [Candidatus Rokubacteria bacterium]|nr:amino acid ABC transporter permease [Candidatus Rokubacteria bacterium]